MNRRYERLSYELNEKDLFLENHPFEPFIDDKTKVLIVGTCPPHRFCAVNSETEKAQETGVLKSGDKVETFWFYGSSENSFWEKVGNQTLVSRDKQDWCKKMGIGFLDLFLRIRRYGDSSSDLDIFPIEIRNLYEYLSKYTNIEKVFFTSSWVMRIAKLEYLKVNQDFLVELNKKKEKINNETISYKYVTKNTFLFKNDNKDNSKPYREVKIYRISSPSGRNSSQNNQGWKDFLEELKKNK